MNIVIDFLTTLNPLQINMICNKMTFGRPLHNEETVAVPYRTFIATLLPHHDF